MFWCESESNLLSDTAKERKNRLFIELAFDFVAIETRSIKIEDEKNIYLLYTWEEREKNPSTDRPGKYRTNTNNKDISISFGFDHLAVMRLPTRL